MNKILMLIGVISLISQIAYAGQKYNSYTGQYETVPDDWELSYNSRTGERSYQPKDATVDYNARNGSYDWSSGHGNDNNK